MNTKCIQCGKEVDLLVAFTAHKICGKCTRANHRKVAGK